MAADTENKVIAIHAGGSTYATNAWIASRMIRFTGCKLPIQWWIADRNEETPWMQRACREVGATIVPCDFIASFYDHPRLEPFARKPYSIYHCGYPECMLLDADIIPVRDVTELFYDPEYLAHGSLFWPDVCRVSPTHPIWAECGIPPDNGFGFQGGQQIVNLSRCDFAMKVTVDMNFSADFWYNLTFGEQDLYRMAWKMVGQEYGMIPVNARMIPRTILEHDRLGRRVFQHRCGDKWSLERDNLRIPDFWFEDRCRSYLEELRAMKDF